MKNAIIMAGGKGTRMKSELPKVLHKILNEPMVGLEIRALKAAGAERIVTIVGYRHEEDATQHYAKVRKSNEELFINL